MKKSSPLLLALLLSTTSVVMAEDPHSSSKSKPSTVGTVVAVEDGGHYIYAQVKIGDEAIWFAAPAMELEVGEKVNLSTAGLPMKGFYSQTLDRTFSMVYFVGAIQREGESKKSGALPPNHPPIDHASLKTPVKFDFSGIETPTGGKTVAEAIRERGELAGKSIVVRGRAVKVSSHIMGKNWIHLQDGSGESGADDLTVTTKAVVELGAVVTMRGTLVIDRDFGSGYKYAVLLEDAVIE